jgi:hypothetical protein
MKKTIKSNIFFKKEKRDVALTVRVPKSTLKKLKDFSKKYNFSQSEVIEALISAEWDKDFVHSDKNIVE